MKVDIGVASARERILADVRHAVSNMRDTDYARRAPGDVVSLLALVDDLQHEVTRLVLDAALAPIAVRVSR